jgi:PmbA protein
MTAPDPLVEYAVRRARKAGAEEAVALLQLQHAEQTRLANNQVTISVSWDSRHLGLFVARKGRTTATNVDTPTRPKIDEAIRRALKLLKMLPVNEDYKGIAAGGFAQPKDSPDGDIAGGKASTNAIMVEARDAALKAGATRTAGTAYTSLTRTSLATSAGALVAATTTGATVSIRAFTDKDASGHWVHASATLKGLDAAGSGRHAGSLAKRARNPVIGSAGKFDVIFDPLAIAALTSNLGNMASATAVESGFSYLGKKIGRSVASKHVTILDDATMRNGLNSIAFDAEGLPTRRTPIVEKGVLKTYLHNTSTATRYKTASTGSAAFDHFRDSGGPGGIITPSPWNLEMLPGTKTREQLFSRVDRGLYVTNIWYTRYQNYVTGDFSTIPRDAILRIERGEVVGPVRDLRISENMRSLFQRISALTAERRQIHSWECETPTLHPYALIERVNVSRSAQ